jgi:hypothetical protein
LTVLQVLLVTIEIKTQPDRTQAWRAVEKVSQFLDRYPGADVLLVHTNHSTASGDVLVGMEDGVQVSAPMSLVSV